jgi:succinate dehydrogenase/fumarate reductase-like Fe-S protein
MPYKDPEVRKIYHKLRSHEHYLKTQEETKQRTKENKIKLRAEWSAFKSTLKCTVCGEDHPAALDFHHTDPNTKDREVSWFLLVNQMLFYCH